MAAREHLTPSRRSHAFRVATRDLRRRTFFFPEVRHA
jgi:hypothetical protein